MDDGNFSSNPGRRLLPIRAFSGHDDARWGPGAGNDSQWQEAKTLALSHGYQSLAETVVAGKGHEPMPAEVMAWFMALRKPPGEN